MRVLQLSDLHFPGPGEALPVPGLTPEGYLRRLSGALRDIASDLVVLSGDLALTAPTERAYATLAGLCAQAGRPAYAIPGNHDSDGLFGRHFSQPQRVLSRGPEHCFAVRAKEQRLLFLDSSAGSVGGEALAWLRVELAKSAGRAYLFMHHPPLLGGAPFMDRAFPLGNPDEVCAVLESCPGGVAVFCGHYHCARDLFRDRVAVHIAPSTLVQLDPEADELTMLPSPAACRLIEIDGDSYHTWIREL